MPIWPGVVTPELFLRMTRGNVRRLRAFDGAPSDLQFLSMGVLNEGRLPYVVQGSFNPFRLDAETVVVQERSGVDNQGRTRASSIGIQTSAGLATLSGAAAQETLNEAQAPSALPSEGSVRVDPTGTRRDAGLFVPDPVAHDFYQEAPTLTIEPTTQYRDRGGESVPATGPALPPPDGATAPTDPGEFYGSGQPDYSEYIPDIGDFLGIGYPGLGDQGPAA